MSVVNNIGALESNVYLVRGRNDVNGATATDFDKIYNDITVDDSLESIFTAPYRSYEERRNHAETRIVLDDDPILFGEDVQIVPPSVGMLTGLVREVIFKGVHFEMHVDVEGYEWIIHSTQASQPGELIGMNIGPDEIHIMKRSEV